MNSAAAETARLALTVNSEQACLAFARARLKAVPEIALFHVGGEGDWTVELAGLGSAQVSVAIQGHARPLPLTLLVLSAFMERDGTGLVLKASAVERLRPDWLEGGYESWIGYWSS